MSFRCQPGRVYGLLGANGAGKTTTLRTLATILAPSGGTARVAGYDIRRDPQKVRAKHRLPFHGHGAVRPADGPRNGRILRPSVRTGRGNAAPPRIETLFAPGDRLSGPPLRHALDRHEAESSIARTLVHDPPVMIFDEPTSGLDVMSAAAIIGFIRECREQGKTVLFSTHVMSEAEKLCDTIGIIHDGCLKTEGTLAELRADSGTQILEEIFVRTVVVRGMSWREHRRRLSQGADRFAARPAHGHVHGAGADSADADADDRRGRSLRAAVRQGHAGDAHGNGARRRRFPQVAGRASRAQGHCHRAAAPDYAQEISNKTDSRRRGDSAGFDAAVERGEIPTVQIYMYQGELAPVSARTGCNDSFAICATASSSSGWRRANSRRTDPALPHRAEKRRLRRKRSAGRSSAGWCRTSSLFFASPEPCIRPWT